MLTAFSISIELTCETMSKEGMAPRIVTPAVDRKNAQASGNRGGDLNFAISERRDSFLNVSPHVRSNRANVEPGANRENNLVRSASLAKTVCS
jgi:hypothetical protein